MGLERDGGSGPEASSRPLGRVTFALLLCASLLAAAAIPGAADARATRISTAKAIMVATEVALRDCRRTPGCRGHGVRACERQSIRKVTCASRIEGVDEQGAYACERPVVVRRRQNGTLKRKKRKQVCAHLQPGGAG